jgi:hypothetical protein
MVQPDIDWVARYKIFHNAFLRRSNRGIRIGTDNEVMQVSSHEEA